MILAGDIGGTKVNLCCMQRVDGRFEETCNATYQSGQYENFEAVLQDWLDTNEVKVDAAVFGVAGPVVQGRVETTNLPWVLDAAALKERFSFRACDLLNDLVATAYGVPELQPDEMEVLQEGHGGFEGTAVLTAAGTGLGEAGLYWNGESHLPIPSEGAHCEFGPRNEVEDEMVRYLRKVHGHVSYERIISGMGIANIYAFLRDTGRYAESGAEKEHMAGGIEPAVISELALAESAELSVAAMRMFVEIYGAETGNLALRIMAYGGAYVGGGIAPKIMPLMRNGLFLKGFKDKGRFVSLMESIPVRVILNDKTALLGAARRGEALLR
jgi:glucokinase